MTQSHESFLRMDYSQLEEPVALVGAIEQYIPQWWLASGQWSMYRLALDCKSTS